MRCDLRHDHGGGGVSPVVSPPVCITTNTVLSSYHIGSCIQQGLRLRDSRPRGATELFRPCNISINQDA